MIAASVVLLVVAVVLLVVGIGKSSVAFLIFSLGATLVAAGLLYASFLYYRRQASEEEKAGAGPGYPTSYVPEATGGAPSADTPVAAASTDPWAGSNGRRPPVPETWDELNAKQAAELISTLGLETLHVVRAHEVENAHRKTVMEAIDRRIEEIVAVRQRLEG